MRSTDLVTYLLNCSLGWLLAADADVMYVVCVDGQLWKYRRDSQLRAVKIQHLPLLPLRLQLRQSRNPRNRRQTTATIHMRRVVVVVVASTVVAVTNTGTIVVTGLNLYRDVTSASDTQETEVQAQMTNVTKVDRALRVSSR